MTSNKIKILIIDDEIMICKMFSGYLEDYGFYVKTAETGTKALEIVAEEKFDAAIVDMRLPDMIGNDFILKANEIQPGIRYFIHTGSLEYVIPGELINIGITKDFILHKPVSDMDEVYQKILKYTK